MKVPGNMGNMQQMMKQAQQMQEKLQQEIAQIKVEATAGGGMVNLRWTGQKNLLSVKIEPDVAGDVEMLQDMVLAAHSEAFKKVEEEIKKKTVEDPRELGGVAGTEEMVDLGQAVGQFLGMSLAQATGHDQLAAASRVLVLRQLEDRIDTFFLRGVDEAARVYDDDLGAICFVNANEAGLRCDAEHDLGVNPVLGTA